MTFRPAIGVDLRALVGDPTGIGFFTLSLLEALARRGGARYLGIAHRRPAEAERLERAGVALETQPAPLGLVWQQFALPRRLEAGDLDLFWSPLITLPLRLPVPGVVTVHDLTPLLLPETHRLKVLLTVLPFLGPSLERARRVVADSRATADDLKFHFPGCASRLSVVYPGVDPEFRPAAPDEIEAVRRELDCPRGYLLFTGSLEPRKNLHHLLDAFEALAARRPGAPPLLLAGPPGWRNRRLLSRIERLGKEGVRHLGRLPRERLIQVVQGATLFVYPSLYEGFGLPPAEAMACGVPTIASDRSSLPEVVGDAGLLVPPDDPGALAAAIARLLDDPALAHDLAHRGRERAARFTWQRAAAEMEALFQEALR